MKMNNFKCRYPDIARASGRRNRPDFEGPRAYSRPHYDFNGDEQLQMLLPSYWSLSKSEANDTFSAGCGFTDTHHAANGVGKWTSKSA